MTSSAIFMMILILSVVWGGFFFCLSKALRREKERSETRK